MLRVVYSNHTEELLADLAGRVRVQQSASTLVPVSVVVSSASVERAVRLGVARACGVAANLEVSLLTRFAAELVESTTGARVADAATFQALALALFLDDAFLALPEVEPLRRYLGAAGPNADALDARRVQLASRVGRIFEQYSYSRGDLLAAWSGRSGRAPADLPGHEETVRWQRHLYRAMLGERGAAEAWARRGGPRVVALHDAVERLALPASSAPLGVHVFALSPFARSFEQLLERLASATDVVVYSLSPCEGFWEDVDPRDPPLLHLWGRPGREHVRALNLASGFDHDDRFVDPGADGSPSLLRTLQADILRRERAPKSVQRDESVVVLEHASVRRELEAVASEIWRLVDADPMLRFDSIALVLPDADLETYLAHLPVVFDEAHRLPLQIAGASLAGDSRVVEAIQLLFALPSSRFTRQDVLRVAMHPAVLATLDDVDPARWLAWADALGIVHGADHSDHEGTYIEGDILNWDQGLRRIALGAFMGGGDPAGDPKPFEADGQQYVPLEVAAGEMRDAAAFGLLLRSLIADARFLQNEERRLSEWAEVLTTLVETYVAPSTDAEHEHVATCLRCIRSIEGADLGDARVRYAVARDLALERLVKLPAGRRGEGVVAGTLAVTRPLPFRVVFACGLGEGRFPAPDAEDPLDLRWAERRAGDVTARERDKFAFLELVLGARDRLYLSYVSRDPLTGDALSPSSVVQDLLRMLDTRYRRPVAEVTRRHPLRRWHPDYFADLFGGGARGTAARPLGPMHLPEARKEAATLALRQALRAEGALPTRDDVIVRSAVDPAWALLASHLGLVSLAPATRAPAGRVAIPMYALVKFLEFPLQGWAKFRLGLDEVEEDDAMTREDEPFETPGRELTVLLRDTFFPAVAAGSSLAAAYDAAARERELRGLGPSGVFARGERDDHLRTLEEWAGGLRDADVSPGGIEVHRFGRGGEHAKSHQVHASLAIDLELPDASGVARIVRVELGGRTIPIGGDASVILYRRNKMPNYKEWADADLERMLIRAFVDHAVLAASGFSERRERRCVTIISSPEGRLVEQATLQPMSSDEAIVWLRDVARDLLGAPHAYFFPCEAVFVHRGRPTDSPLVPVIEMARRNLRDADGSAELRSAYGPVPRLRDYPIPDEATARAMAAARFGAFFEKVQRRREPR